MNEFSIGNIFRVENRNPKYAIPYFTCDYLVNAVCLAYEMPWEKSFKLLYKQAHKLCRMPNDNKCMKAMLNELRFFQQPTPKNNFECREYLDYCVKTLMTEKSAF